MSDNENKNTEDTKQSRPRRERKGRNAAKKDTTEAVENTAVATLEAETDDAEATSTDDGKKKSTETTYKKMLFIRDYCKENGEQSINQLMKLVLAEFGSRIAFEKAKEAREAFRNGTEIKQRDGRRDRRGRNMTRHESQQTMVVVVEDGDVKESHLCDDDDAAVETARKLNALGTPTDNIQIYVRYSASAQISFG